MNVPRVNIMRALILAIETRERQEKQDGYWSDSAGLGGWREVLTALERGEHLTLTGGPDDGVCAPL